MAAYKISDLPALGTVQDSDLLLVSSGAVSYQATAAQVAATGAGGSAAGTTQAAATFAMPSVGNSTDFGSIDFTASSGTGAVELVVAAYGSGYTQTKVYLFGTSYNSTGGAWWTLVPSFALPAMVGNDFAVDISSTAYATAIRVRRLSGSTASQVSVTVQANSGVASAWTPLSSTFSDAPSVTYGTGITTSFPGPLSVPSLGLTGAVVAGGSVAGTSFVNTGASATGTGNTFTSFGGSSVGFSGSSDSGYECSIPLSATSYAVNSGGFATYAGGNFGFGKPNTWNSTDGTFAGANSYAFVEVLSGGDATHAPTTHRYQFNNAGVLTFDAKPTVLPSIADASAPNGSLFWSLTAPNSLKARDPSGTLHTIF